MIAALALCGTCFLSCEKEESLEPKLKQEYVEVEVVNSTLVGVSSFEFEVKTKYKGPVLNCSKVGVVLFKTDTLDFENGYVAPTTDKSASAAWEINDRVVGKVYYTDSEVSADSTATCRITGLQPGTTYYYKTIFCKSLYGDSHVGIIYGELASFTTKDVDILVAKRAKTGPHWAALFGTSAKFTTLETDTNAYKPHVNLYISKSKEDLSAEKISSVTNVKTVELESSGTELSDSIKFNWLQDHTQYYVRAAFAEDIYHKHMSDIVYIATNEVTYTANPIDMGLSVQWSDRNLGAEYIEDYGAYFAWGETEPKKKYTKENYLNKNLYGKTWFESLKDTVILAGNPTYDAATAKLGKGWRIMSITDIMELEEKCEKTKCERNGATGFLYTAANGNSIFLPRVYMAWDNHYLPQISDGCSYYLFEEDMIHWCTSQLKDDDEGVYWDAHFCDYYGMQIRPVYVGE